MYIVSNILYNIVIVLLLQYILLLPSFYHLLGRFLVTLGLHAQVGDPSYRTVRYVIGFT